MSESRDPSGRDSDLSQIRTTYQRYRLEGRHRLWDISNPGFARMMRDRDQALVNLLERSLPRSGATVLDLGSGDGRLAGIVRDAKVEVASWTGVDLDRASVAAASVEYPWATFQEASADALPFAEATFDAVVATTLFSSLPSAEIESRVAAEIRRVLKPGGWLIWYDLRYDNPSNPNVHGLGRASLARLLPGWDADVRPITLLPPLARRLGPLTPLLYRLLEVLPPLRSHLIGRLRRPASSTVASTAPTQTSALR